MHTANTKPDFSTADAFREALDDINQSILKNDSQQSLLAARIGTPLGDMIAISDGRKLRLLEFYNWRALPTELKRMVKRHAAPITSGRDAVHAQISAELDAYFAGRSATFQTPIAWTGTPFTVSVWTALCNIEPGRTISYGELAGIIGRPTAVRAVARANGANELAILVPCHRVIGADGSLTGYAGGLDRKRWLIEHEKRCFGSTSSRLSAHA